MVWVFSQPVHRKFGNRTSFLPECSLLLPLCKHNFIEAEKLFFPSGIGKATLRLSGQESVIFVVGMECLLDTVLAPGQVPPNGNI